MADQGGVSINLEVEDRVSPAIKELARRVEHLEPALDEIGASQVAEVQHRFEQESGPDGKKWRALAPSTLAQRKASSPKILRVDANLFDSVTHQVVPGAVRVGTNRRYGRIHQLGGKAGRGRKVTIPARPYLGLSQEGEREIEQILRDHVAKGVVP